jgi:radical SAM protein with 4Fe4S-binding SPASM domain
MSLVQRLKRVAKRYLTLRAPMAVAPSQTFDESELGRMEDEAAAHMEAIVEERPIQVNIETTTLCNARCTFCAYPKVSRPKSVMTMDVFEKICRDFESLGGGLLGLSPMMSDPLVDPFVMDRIRLANEKFPTIRMHMFTNLIGLSRFSDDDVLLLLRSLRHINVSIGGLEADGYAEMFGVHKFDAVYASLLRLGTLNQQIGSKCELILNVRTNKAAATEQHPRMAALRKAGYRVMGIASEFSDFGGIVTQDHVPEGIKITKVDRSQDKVPCLIAMSYMGIDPDGAVAGCACFDGRGATTIGDVRSASLRDIWASARAKQFRFAFKTGETPDICKTCAFYLPYTTTFKNRGLKDFDPSRDSFWDKIV